MAKKIKRIDVDERAPVQLVGETFNKLADIAEEEERDMGGQVAYMVKNMCNHPVEKREKYLIVAAPVYQTEGSNQTAHVGTNQPYRGFKCLKCGMLVIPADTDGLVAEAMNAPLVGVTK